jgi:hypothetical protein
MILRIPVRRSLIDPDNPEAYRLLGPLPSGVTELGRPVWDDPEGAAGALREHPPVAENRPVAVILAECSALGYLYAHADPQGANDREKALDMLDRLRKGQL